MAIHQPQTDLLPAFSDEALARGFASRHANELRYVAATGTWMWWDGTRWCRDVQLRTVALVRKFCAEMACDPQAAKVAKSIASAKTIRSVEALARADFHLAATADQWDADHMALNTPDGVIDLRTGARRPAMPELYMTRITAIAPGGECPVFHAFLNQITAGDGELVAYWQRLLGYALTGDTSEHALFFGYGTGGNGKSVLIDTVAGILGSYSRSAPIETFAESGTSRHPTELAGLQGARLVTAVETEEGRRWAESRIKTLTGGDKISARFMRQDFFEYQPEFKLLITGNHKPGLRSVDEAMRRRFHLIPFPLALAKVDRDPHLKEKLKAEWPGILAWMIEGCLRWQELGLRPPTAVTAATLAYFEAEDLFGSWLEECCEATSGGWEFAGALFASWKAFAERAGESPGSGKRLSQMLEKRGFEPRRTSHARGFQGLRLRAHTVEPFQ